MENLTPVIGSEYCVPNPIKLTIDPHKGVTQINNDLIFQVQKPVSCHRRRVLRDFSGKPILNVSKKIRSIHSRWQVLKCDSKDDDDLVFSVKRSSVKTPHESTIALDVFLANNTKELDWDYKVIAGSGNNSCDIYAQGSSTILVKMVKDSGAFVGEIQPNVDYAFIVALITIVDKFINSRNRKMGKAIKNTIEGVLALATLGDAVYDAVNMFYGGDEDDEDDGDDDV